MSICSSVGILETSCVGVDACVDGLRNCFIDEFASKLLDQLINELASSRLGWIDIVVIPETVSRSVVIHAKMQLPLVELVRKCRESAVFSAVYADGYVMIFQTFLIASNELSVHEADIFRNFLIHQYP